MKNFKHVFAKTLLSLFMVTSALNGFAADDIRLGTPGYGGTGCPANTASVTLSPDAKTLSIIFDQYVAEAGYTTGRTLDRKTCNIAIPVHVPQGYSVSILKFDYRGFVSVPRGENQFNVEYFFAGYTGPKFRKTFTSGAEQEYLLGNSFAVETLSWSRCGEDVNLRINSSLQAKSFNGQTSMITLDSADIHAGIVYQLQWRRC
jgi:hypothetical protein